MIWCAPASKSSRPIDSFARSAIANQTRAAVGVLGAGKELRNAALGVAAGRVPATVRTVNTEAAGRCTALPGLACGVTIATIRGARAARSPGGNAATVEDVADGISVAAVRGVVARVMDIVRDATLSCSVTSDSSAIATVRDRFAAGSPELNAARAAVAGCVRIAAVRVGNAGTRDSRGTTAPPRVVADHRRSGKIAALRAGRVATDIAKGNAAHAEIAGFISDAAIGVRTTRGRSSAGGAALAGIADHGSVSSITTIKAILAGASPEADAARTTIAGCIRIATVGVLATGVRFIGCGAAPSGRELARGGAITTI